MDAAHYLLAQERLPQVIERLFCASTIAAIATRDLDGVVVINATNIADNSITSSANQREKLRDDIRVAMNKRLTGMEVGIQISRVDLTNTLPANARPAFDQVLAAEADAARILASARTGRETYRQQGERERVAAIQSAEATAKELITKAHVATDGILALNTARTPEQRALLLDRLYRERIENVLRKAGLVTVVDGREPIQLLLPGGIERK
jgi:regulator of protease activity HflC (stomatin/prohibitin superfamily)